VDAVRQFVQSTPDDDLDTARAKRALRALEMVMAASWEDAPALAALAQFASNTANLIAECRLRCMREAGKLVAEVERAAHSATEEPA
jgi:hypothetical protein